MQKSIKFVLILKEKNNITSPRKGEQMIIEQWEHKIKAEH
jgi:hypothetical protein